MGIAADEISFAFGIGAERKSSALITTSTTMGTGTGTHPRAWTA